MIDAHTMSVATKFGQAYEDGKLVGARVLIKSLSVSEIMRLDFAIRQDPTIFAPDCDKLVRDAVNKIIRSKTNVEKAKAQGITPEQLYENNFNEMFEDYLPR